MPKQSTLLRIVLVLAIIALAMFIAERLWLLGAALGNIVSIIGVSWLLGLFVKPFINYLRGGLAPPFVIRWIDRRYGERAARRAAVLRLPFGLAVGIVYVLLIVVIVGGLSFATASIIPQAVDLVQRLPEISSDLPVFVTNLWRGAAPRLGMNPNAFDINQFISPQEISARAAQLAGWLATQAVSIAALTAGAIGQLFIVLVLSLYVVAEDKLIERQLFTVLPMQWHEMLRAMSSSITRAFNGYLRSQVISALLHAASALLIFTVFGLNFGVVVALLFAVLSFIPLVGIPLAVFIAALVTLISLPSAVVPVVAFLFVVDQIVAYGVVPRLMTESTGVPSLIAMMSIIIGVQLLGFWGLVFGVPIVGSVYAIVFDVILPRRRKALGLPEGEPSAFRSQRRQSPASAPVSPARGVDEAASPAATTAPPKLG